MDVQKSAVAGNLRKASACRERWPPVYKWVAPAQAIMTKADYFICPDCGAEVRVGSRGCARCASDRATKAWDDHKPWEQDEAYDGVDLPDENFDYEEFVDQEFGGRQRRSRHEWFWWAVAVVLLVSLAVSWVWLARR